jgi:hypothetical protein
MRLAGIRSEISLFLYTPLPAPHFLNKLRNISPLLLSLAFSYSRDNTKMATITATPVLFPATTDNKPAKAIAVDVVEVPAEAAIEYEILTVKKKDGTIKKVRRPIKKDAQPAPAPAEAPKGITENDVLLVTTTTSAPAPAPVEAPKPAEPSFVVLTTTTTTAPAPAPAAPAPVAAAPGKIYLL